MIRARASAALYCGPIRLAECGILATGVACRRGSGRGRARGVGLLNLARASSLIAAMMVVTLIVMRAIERNPAVIISMIFLRLRSQLSCRGAARLARAFADRGHLTGRLIPEDRDGRLPPLRVGLDPRRLLIGGHGRCQTLCLHQAQKPSYYFVSAAGTSRCSHLIVVFQVQSPNSDVADPTVVIPSTGRILLRQHLLPQQEQHPNWFGKLSTNADNRPSP